MSASKPRSGFLGNRSIRLAAALEIGIFVKEFEFSPQLGHIAGHNNQVLSIVIQVADIVGKKKFLAKS
jgi:hypothetical protein